MYISFVLDFTSFKNTDQDDIIVTRKSNADGYMVCFSEKIILSIAVDNLTSDQ